MNPVLIFFMSASQHPFTEKLKVLETFYAGSINSPFSRLLPTHLSVKLYSSSFYHIYESYACYLIFLS